MISDIEQLPDCTLVTLTGSLTGRVTTPLYDQILGQIAPQRPRVLLDLSGVTYLSSAALRLLLLLYRVVDQRSGLMVLAGLSDEVYDILTITGFSDVFEVFPDREAARARLR
ncbi:MAG: STAS domain-containing protein [Anaerolineae bacterium]|jgi:anti-sigma B factor antagonist|nr:STAS domain-containing protein [Anaerolineae bacterium]